MALGLLLLALAAISVVAVLSNLFFGERIFEVSSKYVKDRCDQTGFACTVATTILFIVGPLLVGSFMFVFGTLRRVRRPLLKAARERPTELVENAGQIVGKVVGRDDVCNVLQDSLRERNVRRPYVVVGGVGIGKTAVIVRLTELLARRGAVPVPIRLRDAETDLDFLEMARLAFLRSTQSSHWLASSAERAWGRLLQDDKIVVLADGLEEALAESDDEIDQERDHRVRLAVTQALRRGYPLVIASREHDALSGLDAALLPLEPLSEEASLDYIEGAGRVYDERRLGWIVKTANVVDTPLYVQIARELHQSGQLRHRALAARGADDASLETRGADHVALRVNLAKRWVAALIEGNLAKEAARVPLHPRDREATVLQLAALACCGLARDTLQPSFEMFEKLEPGSRGMRPTPVYPALSAALENRLQALREEKTRAQGLTTVQKSLHVDIELAASNGVRLGLVERRQRGVRFPHSTMQAYLGSMLIGEALKDIRFQRDAFVAPGRELLIALAMFSRKDEAAESHPQAEVPWRSWLCARLCKAAGDVPETDVKRLELLTTAIEVDSVVGPQDGIPVARNTAPARELVKGWDRVSSWEDAPRDAKMIAVARVGDAARRLGEAARKEKSPERAPGARKSGVFDFYRRLYDICRKEENYRIRLAAAQEVGDGGVLAFDALEENFREDMPKSLEERRTVMRDRRKTFSDRKDQRYRYSTQAWLLPMLVGSVGEDDEVPRRLEDWLELVGEGMPLWLEAALAQGFKFAANRRPQHPYEMAETRSYLAARAEDMLQKADFWYSRLTLLHALCLWALAGALSRDRDQDEQRDFRAVVKRWIRRDQEHWFVREAGDLVVKALETKQPARFVWIDESGVTTTVGSRSGRKMPHALRTQWIPPSAGWLILDRRAQQLVADVLIVLTLAERGETAGDWERNLERINTRDLPACLTQERCEHLRPAEAAGVTQRSPGETCKGGCPVGLCPYPPKGQKPHRVELSEPFCRNQRQLLAVRQAARFAGRAKWQNAPRSDLKRFWREMEMRART